MNGYVTLAYISSSKPVSQFDELDVVRLKRDVETTDGRMVPMGSMGAVLVTWDLGLTYEVEFSEPFVATALVAAGDLEDEMLGR